MNQSLARLTAGTLLATGALVAVAPVVSAEGIGEDTSVLADVSGTLDLSGVGLNVLSDLGTLADQVVGATQGATARVRKEAAAAQPTTPPPAATASASQPAAAPTAAGNGVALRPKVDVGIKRTEAGGVDLSVNGGVGAAANLAPAAPGAPATPATGDVLAGDNSLLGGISAFLRELLGIR
jgi:hypothetical protein